MSDEEKIKLTLSTNKNTDKKFVWRTDIFPQGWRYIEERAVRVLQKDKAAHKRGHTMTPRKARRNSFYAEVISGTWVHKLISEHENYTEAALAESSLLHDLEKADPDCTYNEELGGSLPMEANIEEIIVHLMQLGWMPRIDG